MHDVGVVYQGLQSVLVHCAALQELAKVRLACVWAVGCGLCGTVFTEHDAHYSKHGLLLLNAQA